MSDSSATPAGGAQDGSGSATDENGAAGAVGVRSDLIAPRLSAACFCSSPATAEAVRSAAQDRRMAKAEIEIVMGGPAAATARYAEAFPPNLIIVETLEPGFGVFGELQALAEVCGPEPQVVVIGPSNDVSLYREYLRQGVSEYLVAPTSALEIIEAVVGIYADPESTPAAKTITVLGVKGGVGASVLTHNIAALISAEIAAKTVLLDLDIEFGTSSLDFNAETKHSVVDALADISGLDDVKLQRLLFQQTEHLHLLPAPASLTTGVEPSEQEVLSLIDVVRYASDVLVIDAPHAWSAGARCALRQSDEVVLVAAPDIANLRNLKAVMDWLKMERRMDAAPRVVLNQTGAPKRPELTAKDFADVLGVEVDLEVPYDGGLFYSAINNGQMLAEVAPNHEAVLLIENFAKVLIGRDPKPLKGKGGFNLNAWLQALSSKKTPEEATANV